MYRWGRVMIYYDLNTVEYMLIYFILISITNHTKIGIVTITHDSSLDLSIFEHSP